MARKPKKWIAVEDDEVRHVWVCSECGEEAVVPPQSYQEVGEPMCQFCDIEMTYDHTEVRK